LERLREEYRAPSLAGLRTAGHTYGPNLAGVGVDAWAVDYGPVSYTPLTLPTGYSV